MSSKEPVYIAGAFEHPTREAPDKSQKQLHAEVARGALDDAGLTKDDVDGYLTTGVPVTEPALEPLVMADYLGLDPTFTDSSDIGGAAFISHVAHAASAIRDDRCDIALITLGARMKTRQEEITKDEWKFHHEFEWPNAATTLLLYAMAAKRHMYEHGTTSEQLAEIRVAASHHAQYNEHALYQDPVSVEDVVESPTIAEPLHLLDCCVVTDGGGALLVVSEDVKQRIDRECVEVLGHGESIFHLDGGRMDITRTGATNSGKRAYEEAGVGPEDVDYASIYDSFTITVLETIEDLGFCEKGNGGEFVEDGSLKAPDGDLPFNTDGGGLASNHPGRGGMTKIIEAVRQLRGEANPEVQVPDARIALAHGTGGYLSTRHGSSTLILGSDNR